jgi:hypothetical protein
MLSVTRHRALLESETRFVHCSICVYDVQVTPRHLNPVCEINRITYGGKKTGLRVCISTPTFISARAQQRFGVEELTDTSCASTHTQTLLRINC